MAEQIEMEVSVNFFEADQIQGATSGQFFGGATFQDGHKNRFMWGGDVAGEVRRIMTSDQASAFARGFVVHALEDRLKELALRRQS
jgi:hypothetical protein